MGAEDDTTREDARTLVVDGAGDVTRVDVKGVQNQHGFTMTCPLTMKDGKAEWADHDLFEGQFVGDDRGQLKWGNGSTWFRRYASVLHTFQVGGKPVPSK